jgi:hypothetical protein
MASGAAHTSGARCWKYVKEKKKKYGNTAGFTQHEPFVARVPFDQPLKNEKDRCRM